MTLLTILLMLAARAASVVTASSLPLGRTCVVHPSGNESIDDAPATTKAFKDCGINGRVVFLNQTYHINTVMNTTGLKNCEVDLRGTLLWGTDISYWLNNSLSTGYQNQSSAWFIGGENIKFDGHGYGTLDGNGQTWYTFVKGRSNYPGRPHALTIWGARNSVFEGIRFVQSQMWTVSIMHSKNVLLQDIYVSSVSHDGNPSRNTDGADTIFSDNITFRRWDVTNGDDGISMKANSTNIRIFDSIFHNGLGIAFGSIGQYKGNFETIENVVAHNITCNNTLHAAYVKTWTGQQVGYPPNGGGGGLGYIKNIYLSAFNLLNLRGPPFAISQCTTFSGMAGDCNSSLFKIQDITFKDAVGTLLANPIASLQCSAAAPCENIAIEDMNFQLVNGTVASGYNCNAVVETVGFNCTGVTCGTGSATGSC